MIAPEPVFTPRGTPFSVIYRIKALSELGHNIDLLTYHIGEDIDIKNLKIHRTLKIPFIKHIKVGPSIIKIFLDILLLIKTIWFLLRNKYDIIHSHEEAAFFSIILSKVFRIPHVYDMHSSLPQQLGNFGFLNCFPFKQIFTFMENYVIRNSGSIITICNDLYDTVKSIDESAYTINIENIFDNSIIFKRDYSVINEYKDILKDKTIVLYYGTMEKYQGIDLLIRSVNKAMDKNNQIFLLLIGGRKDQIMKYKNLVKFKDRVLFLDPVKPGELEPFIDMARILITTRIKGTNTPLKLYGYIRAGKPIIATDIYSHTQVLNKDISVLCEPVENEIAQSIIELISNENRCNELAQNCLAYAEKHYPIEKYIDDVKKAYSFHQIK